MAHLVGDLAKYFQFDDINIDNWHFKLYYKGCSLLFFIGSMVGMLSQYFGEPIQCDFVGIDSDVASDYCWIHGSSYIPTKFQPHMKCIADLEGVESEDDAPDTSYYQWVTFVQLFQAGMFLLPHKIWTAMEGGLVQSFGKDGRAAVILSEDSKCDEGIIMETVSDKFVKYFKAILHHNQWYFAKFVACELLSIFLIFFNFWATDKFLQGKFWYYGLDVINYFSLHRSERKVVVSPFCATFPTEVSCTVPNVGAAGGEQSTNGLCVLSQNIINEKIYLVLWFYLVFVCVVSVLFLFFRLCTLFFEPLRFVLLYSKISHRYDEDVRKSLRFVMNKCYLGDWFVLLLISQNVNMYFFRNFIKDLRDELKDKPKRSRSMRSNSSVGEKEKDSATYRRRVKQKEFEAETLLTENNEKRHA